MGNKYSNFSETAEAISPTHISFCDNILFPAAEAAI